MLILSQRSSAAVSRNPGDDPDGGQGGLLDVRVLLLGAAPFPQQGELIQQDVAADRSFAQAGQSA